MSSGGSTKVIIISLCANFGIALSKLGGAMFTGSAALLAESVHSFSDCGNQLLLLYGQRVSKKPPTPKHPLGRGKEAFFWSFLVALLLFSMGGLFSLTEGWEKISHPHALTHPIVGVIILLVAVGLEGFSFFACLKEVKHQNTYGSIWQWVRHTSSADLLVIFLEDLAALLGLLFALTSLVLAWITGNPFWDALGSVAIGVLLIGVAILLGKEVKAMLIGEASSTNYETALRHLVQEYLPGGHIARVIAVQTGIDEVLLAYKVVPGDYGMTVADAIAQVNALEARVKQQFPQVRWQFAELDSEE